MSSLESLRQRAWQLPTDVLRLASTGHLTSIYEPCSTPNTNTKEDVHRVRPGQRKEFRPRDHASRLSVSRLRTWTHAVNLTFDFARRGGRMFSPYIVANPNMYCCHSLICQRISFHSAICNWGFFYVSPSQAPDEEREYHAMVRAATIRLTKRSSNEEQ